MARRSTFGFDPSKPVKKGRLLKQGAFHKAFKVREFILYPGFLVYYDNENSWRLDITKGQTLGGRLGAVKLKGANVEIARNAPKGCKFGIMVTAPDPANKRQSYLMNASSKEERDSWIEVIRNASPSSPRMKKAAEAAKLKEEHRPAKSPESSEDRLRPSPVERQTTATDAAVAAAQYMDAEAEEKQIEEMAASVTGSLKGIDGMLRERHNTATMAALSIHIEESLENGADDASETNIDSLFAIEELEDEQPETSIDVLLGVQENGNKSSEEGSVSTDSNSRVTSPMSDISGPMHDISGPMHVESERDSETQQLESQESIRTSHNEEGEETVTTSVTVSCSSLDRYFKTEENGTASESEQSGRENGQEESKKDDELEVELEKPKKVSSTQILISDEATTVSVNLANYDSDDTLSEEESMENLDSLVKQAEEEEEEEKKNECTQNEGTDVPATAGESTISSITVKEDRTGNSAAESNDSSKLSPPQSTRRRSSSTPFIEKRGFLYKMGGQRKSWKLRYFVLRPGAFQYFKDSRCQKMLGEVKLKNLSIFFPGVGERKQSFQFTIHTESSWNRRPDYVLASQSEREMKEWIAAFKSAGQKVGYNSPAESDEEAQH